MKFIKIKRLKKEIDRLENILSQLVSKGIVYNTLKREIISLEFKIYILKGE